MREKITYLKNRKNQTDGEVELIESNYTLKEKYTSTHISHNI